ncbi:hypothetical protein MMC18_004449 [Xylographa bjoerkii]|nr:hypothetical protein [Xylographa bjoerkii]
MRTSTAILTVLAISFATVSARPQAVSEYTDGQPQVVTEISDGQPQAPMPTVSAAGQASDGQVEASATVSSIASAPTTASSTSGTSGCSNAAAVPSARVLNGTYMGLHSPQYDEDFFLGIPYAQPPLNDLRFTIPQSLNTTFSESRAADSYSAECVGYGGDDIGYTQSEDCLTLNVIRPAGYECELLPVAIWFHGGGNYMGGSADERYNLSFIVQNSVAIGKPIIGVSANYRLAAWGFLFSEEVAGSGNTNIALRDQRLALHWLQENIASFGGDPTKVTIWGESAGALDVGLQLVAYGGRNDNIFRGGIMESGNPVSYSSFNGTNFYQPLYDDIVQMVGCSEAIDSLQCLRTVPFEQLNEVLKNSPFNTSFAPVVDGDFIQRFGSIQLAQGAFNKVPIISGSNTDEGISFGIVGINNDTGFLHYLENTTQATGTELNAKLSQQILAAYPMPTAVGLSGIPAEVATTPASDGLEYRRTSAYAGDAVFTANRRLTCATWAAAGVPAYCYRFNAQPAGVTFVPHFQEVAFVFYNIEGYGYNAEHSSTPPFQDKPQSYIDLSRLMTSSWASFVYDQDPNSFRAANPTVAGTTELWPVYNVESPMDYVFDANVSSYAEPDTYRAAGIALINEASVAYRR